MEHGLRIVAADDEQEMTLFYQEALTLLGHEATVAENGRRLVESCRSVGPDLVIADVNMPEMNGIDAVEQVWRESRVPVILVSGYDRAQFREPDRDGQFLLVLRKPISLADLDEAITLARRHLHEDANAGLGVEVSGVKAAFR